MSLQDLGSLGEFVAAIATVVTLAYLALQIRQNTRALQGSAHETATSRRTSWLMSVAKSPELNDLMMRFFAESESLTPSEVNRAQRLVSSILLGVETSYWQWRRGNLEEEQWQPALQILRNTLARKQVRDWWALGDNPQTAEFRALVEEELEKL